MYAAAHLLAVRRANAAAARMRDRGAPAAEVTRVRATLRGAGLDAAYGAAPGKPPAEMRVADAPRPPPPLGAIAAGTAQRAAAMVAEETARILAREWIERAENARGRVAEMNALFNLNKPPAAETMEEMRAFDATTLGNEYAAISRGLLSVELVGDLDEEHANFGAEMPNIQGALDKLSGWYDAEIHFKEMQKAAAEITRTAKKLPREYGFYIREYFMERAQEAMMNYEWHRREIERIIDGSKDRAAIEGKMDEEMATLGGKINQIIEHYEKPMDPEMDENAVQGLIKNLRLPNPTTPTKASLAILRKITGEQTITNAYTDRYYSKVLVAYVRPDLYFENTDGAADAIRDLCTSTAPNTTVFRLTDSRFAAVFLAAMPYVLSAPDAWARAKDFVGADPAEVRAEMTDLLLLHWDPAQSYFAEMSWMPASDKRITPGGILEIVRESETLDDAVGAMYTFNTE